jgi:iron-sulfur cluster repair protein YtfE (RIC family)
MTHSRTHNGQGSGSILGSSVKGLLLTAGVAAIANLGRKMAVQAPTAMAQDWCEGLIKEHKATLAVIDKLEQISPEHPERRSMLLMNLKHMITKHAMQEENVIYPVLRRGDNGDAADQLNSDHGEVKAMLYELGHMDKGDPAFNETLGRLRSALEEHMRQEEDELFPALRERLSDEENKKLSREMNMAGLMLA